MIIKNSKNNNMNQNHEMTYKTILPQERVIIDNEFSKYPIEIYWTKENLFTPNAAANHLIDVLTCLRPENTGQCLAFDGTVIEP
jgi:hypothetical protein